MFKISKEYNLDICGPSFLKKGKISYKITIHKLNTLLTYTNFVEVCVPLFNRTSLDNLMKKLDYSLIGWGIDYLYIICNGIEKKKSYAIIHKIVCVNPLDTNKGGKRELTNVLNCKDRIKIWNKFKRKHKLSDFVAKNYESIPLPL